MKSLLIMIILSACLLASRSAWGASEDQITTVWSRSDTTIYSFSDFRVFADLSQVSQAVRDSLIRAVWCVPTDQTWAVTKFLVDSVSVTSLKAALAQAGLDTSSAQKWSQQSIAMSASQRADVRASGISDKAVLVRFLNIIAVLRQTNPGWDDYTARAAAKGVVTKF